MKGVKGVIGAIDGSYIGIISQEHCNEIILIEKGFHLSFSKLFVTSTSVLLIATLDGLGLCMMPGYSKKKHYRTGICFAKGKIPKNEVNKFK